MKSYWIAVAALLAAKGVMAQAGTGPYIDPVLRFIARAEVRRSLDQAAAVAPGDVVQTVAGRLAVTRSAGLTRVSTFMEVRDAQALARLRDLGANIGSYRDGIATVDLPVSLIEQLGTMTGIVAVEAAHTLTVQHDSSMRAIKVNDVRSLSGGVWTGSTGRGVIVAIYDTGIDFKHQDFRDSNGQTRLLALWDQTRSGTPPSGFTQGHMCTRDVIQRVIDVPTDGALCPQLDTNGHGTHTAGSAAGDGSATGNGGTAGTYAGVAPNADLIIVKGGNGSFSETGILDGLRWLEQEGRQRGRPMVVNMSLGGQTGAHDGSRTYEKGIDALSRPGFIVVISSGNEGNNVNITPAAPDTLLIHGTGNASTGATKDFTFRIPTFPSIPPLCNEAVGFSFWYKAQDRLRITVLRPNGTSHSVDTGQGSSQDNVGGNISIDNAANGVSAQNGDNEALIQINDCGASGSAPSSGTYTLRVATIGTGSGQPYHFWMTQNFLGGASLARGMSGFDNRYIVGSPGNARTAITVGAFATRMCWPTGQTQTCFVQREAIGDLARFSSGGPTRDGRIKPEITAPGMAVVSALSTNATAAANRIVPDGVHWSNQGTSMAAPHVTGAIALLLEVKPTITSDEVRQVFARTAARDNFTSRTYSNEPGSLPADWWGYGKLDVPAALCGVGGGTATFVRVTPALDTLPQNATVKIDACVANVAGGVIFTSTNSGVASVDATGLVRALQPGTTLIIAQAATLADTAVITVVAPSTVIANGQSIAPTQRSLSPAGTRLPLLRMGLRVNGVEPVRIQSLSFELRGDDPNAKVIVAQDLNRNGQLESSDRILANVARPNRGIVDTVRVPMTDFTIAQRDSAAIVVGVELSGAAPNNSEFQVTFLASRTETIGTRSGAQNRLEPITVTLASNTASTTVLEQDAVFSLSENPIRSRQVVFNFQQPPATASIYTLTGRRVRDLKRGIDHAGRVIWNLENDDGNSVAPGVYLLVFDVGGAIVREKLFVLTPRN